VNIYVVDASVAIKWFVDDDDTEANIDQATQLLIAAQRQDALFLQPPHWVSEVAAVLARLTPKTAGRSVGAILALAQRMGSIIINGQFHSRSNWIITCLTRFITP
jgi:predicted nucleic acid-binding protein